MVCECTQRDYYLGGLLVFTALDSVGLWISDMYKMDISNVYPRKGLSVTTAADNPLSPP